MGIKNAMSNLLLFFFFVIYLFQPVLHDIRQAKSQLIENVISYGLAKASSGDVGQFSPEIIKEMEDKLEQVGIHPSDVLFKGTTSLTLRGDYIKGELRVKNSPLWMMWQGPQEIVRSGTMMSEYIER